MQGFPFYEKPVVSSSWLRWGAALCRQYLPALPWLSSCGPSTQLPLPLPPTLQRVSYARTTSNKVVLLKGGKAAKQLAKGKPPKAPAAAAAEGEGAAKKVKQPEAAAVGGKAAAAAAGVDVGRPNSKLFIENLPAATTAAMLEMLFQQFPGALLVCLLSGAQEEQGGKGSSREACSPWWVRRIDAD